MEPVISTVDTKDSITTWIADEAIDFIETRDTTRPFFLWTSFTKPHPPFDPCRDFGSVKSTSMFFITNLISSRITPLF